MTLQEATRWAGAALHAGDLKGLKRALEARRRAIDTGEAPTQEAFAAGEALLAGLRELQKKAACDSARLGQIRRYVEFHTR